MERREAPHTPVGVRTNTGRANWRSIPSFLRGAELEGGLPGGLNNAGAFGRPHFRGEHSTAGPDTQRKDAGRGSLECGRWRSRTARPGDRLSSFSRVEDSQRGEREGMRHHRSADAAGLPERESVENAGYRRQQFESPVGERLVGPVARAAPERRRRPAPGLGAPPSSAETVEPRCVHRRAHAARVGSWWIRRASSVRTGRRELIGGF